MKSVAVFCGSNYGKKASYLDSSIHLAEVIVRLEMRLIYGGGAVGLMGAVANKVLELGGEAI